MHRVKTFIKGSLDVADANGTPVILTEELCILVSVDTIYRMIGPDTISFADKRLEVVEKLQACDNEAEFKDIIRNESNLLSAYNYVMENHRVID